MKSKKKLLRKSRIYLILDKKTCGKKSLTSVAKTIKKAKIDVVQLRDKCSNKYSLLKAAIKLKSIFSKSNKIFIINDYPDIAKIIRSDGVHLGQCDTSIKDARKLLGKNALIGKSCHSLKQALKAQNEGADYIGIGPIYSTKTKPDYTPIGVTTLSKLKGLIKIPYFAIGDINTSNIDSICKAGSKRVAVCRAVLESKHINKTVRCLYKSLSIK